MSAPFSSPPISDRRADILRATARRLASGAPYRWTHMGQCNCGHLAQTVSDQAPAEIHRKATLAPGDWREQVLAHEAQSAGREPAVVDLCPTTNRPLDAVIDSLVAHGFSHADLAHLERLSAPVVVRSFPAHERQFDHRSRADVVRYMRRWADFIAAEQTALV